MKKSLIALLCAVLLMGSCRSEPSVVPGAPTMVSRSSAARREFMRRTGYPNGRPGYIVDHIIPLKRGGVDAPSNMQWQTDEEAKAKDKWE